MSEWGPPQEVPIIDKDEYYFAVDELRRPRDDGSEDQMVFIHLSIFKWTPSVYKEVLRNWKSFREHVVCPLYAVGGVVEEDVAKWERFVTRLGFKFLTNVVCTNGAERRLFIHQKE